MGATLALPLLADLIAVALFFDFLNGLHDAANTVAVIAITIYPRNAARNCTVRRPYNEWRTPKPITSRSY